MPTPPRLATNRNDTHPTPGHHAVTTPCIYRHRSLGAIAVWLALLAALTGCGSLPPSMRGMDPATGAPPQTPVESPLVTEQRWLAEWFRGTPVLVTLTEPQTLGVDTPLAHCFNAGSSTLKPALAAVLDQVATSLRRQPAMRVAIAAPADAGGNARLAASRAQTVREHLVSRGVAATRLTGSGTAPPGGAVQLRIVLGP